MLSIRMKRLGRKGHPTYRVVVQDSRQSPTSGKYVALLGSYDPHTKQSTLVKDKAEFYLKHGAQPSDRVVSLFQTEKITLPKWVKQPTKKEKSLRNPEKLRKNRSEDAAPAEKPEASEQSPVEEETAKSDEKPEAPEKTEETKTAETKTEVETESEEPKADNEATQAAAVAESKPGEAADDSSTEDKS